METIQIKDKSFSVFIKEEEIQKQVKRVAKELSEDLKGKKPLFLSVLNGSFMFAGDLLRNMKTPCEVSFIKLASYGGDSTTGVVKEIMGLSENIEGRVVVIVEDIVDTGYTMQKLLSDLKKKNPKEILIATLLMKPDKLRVELNVDYVAIEIPNDFIVGYGLDYDGFGRNYRDIYKIIE